MSADSHAVCPKCEREVEEAGLEVELAQTLAEYHEMYFDGGRFHVNYKGRCRKCGFTYEFKCSERVNIT